MRSLKRVHNMVVLVALIVVLPVLMTSPVRADTSIVCTGTLVAPTEVPSTNGNVHLTATGPHLPNQDVCELPAGNVVNGNVIITGVAQFQLEGGTINGNIEGSGSSSFEISAGATLNGNAIQEGSGGIFLGNTFSIPGGTTIKVDGNIEQKGTSHITFFGNGTAGVDTIHVTGNVTNESQSSGIAITARNADVVKVDGSVEAKGGGNQVFDTGVITIDGSVCGGPPVGYGAAGVTVNGDIKSSC